jgi:NTE family protein
MRPFVALLLTMLILSLPLALPCPCLAAEQDTNNGNSPETHKLHLNLVRPRVGLALGGGGTRGAAHVGVLRMLEQANVPVDCIVGTSMGAVVGGLYCAGVSVDQIEALFVKDNLMKEFLTVPLGLRLAVVPIFLAPRLVGHRSFDGLYRGNKFRNFLVKALPEHQRNIEDLKIPFGAVTLDLLDGNIHTLKTGSLGYAMQASSAVPVLRKPVPVDGRLFVDGGVIANLPVKETRAMGADIVIAVDVDERFEPVDAEKFKYVGSVAHRVMTLHLSKVDENQRADADIVIHPNVNGISLISTKAKDLKAAIEAGENAAILALPDLCDRLRKDGIIVCPAELEKPSPEQE